MRELMGVQWCETENPLWGLTTNPSNPELTPGGSTGGESALLALRGSLMGWGTVCHACVALSCPASLMCSQDIGGSVRIPAHIMGIYGFKPSVSYEADTICKLPR